MSVPIAFIMPARPRPARRRLTRGLSAGPTATGATPLPTRSTRSARSRAACGRPTDSARAGGIVERDRVHRQRLDLAREHVGREARLLDRARAAGLDHLARIGGLVIVGRRGERDQDRGTPGGGQLGDGRSARRGRSPDARRRACPACPRCRSSARRECRARHIGSRTRSMSSGRHCWTTCRRRRSDGSSMPSPSGTTSLEHGRALASAGDEDLQRRDLVERRERQLAEPRDLLAHRIADQHGLARDICGFSRSTWS